MNIAMSLQDAEGHDRAVLELANEYWLQSHRIRRALAEGVDVSAEACRLLVQIKANKSRRVYDFNLAAIVADELLQAIDAELIYQAEQDITAQEVA